LVDKFIEQVRACHERALDAKRSAERTADPALKIGFVELEKRWLRLADSYVLAEKLADFIAASLEWRRRFEEPSRVSERPHHALRLQGTLRQLDVLARQAADLKAHREMETLREIKQHLRWLASVVEWSDAAIIGEHLDGIIQSWNQGAERLFGYLVEEVVGRDITERKRREAQFLALASEAEHRARNLFANVAAIVGLSQSDTPKGLKEAIRGRIRALASVHSLFAKSRWTGAELAALVKQELLPYSREGEKRTQIDGPAIMVQPKLAQAMAVALHELATNAAKYGALSGARGQVRVEWSCGADRQLVLRWTEGGGPPVSPPTRKGFGTGVMERMIRDGVNGRVQLDWRVEGLACEIAVPT
jgi:two-component sensor histidine kinase